MFCQKCKRQRDGKFCSECGTKLIGDPQEIIQAKIIIDKATEEVKKCSAANHKGYTIIEETNKCLNCLEIKANAFSKIAASF